jgi:ComF family protein
VAALLATLLSMERLFRADYEDGALEHLLLSPQPLALLALAPLLGRLMANRLGHVDEGWTIVPVPLHRWRLWQRGFNQAALLAREIARRRNAALLVDALVRRRRTPSLGGLGRKARARAVAGAITLDPRRAAAIAGANVVLVDDVLTSGATSEVCVAALLRGGANRVVIACFARVLNDAG